MITESLVTEERDGYISSLFYWKCALMIVEACWEYSDCCYEQAAGVEPSLPSSFSQAVKAPHQPSLPD